MSSITTAQPSSTPAPDEFVYGWRYLAQPQADGTVRTVIVPLTLEDLLHPQEGDKVAHAEPHERRGVYLYTVIEYQIAGQPGTVVLKDVRIDWNNPNIKPHGPDLMVIAGVRERKPWSTFYVGIEGVRPSMIIEITSPETRAIDLGPKVVEYAQAEVPLYIIVDSDTARAPMRLLGYERVDGQYRELAPDDRGYLWLAPVGVWLGVVGNEPICFDQRGEPIGNFGAQVVARVAAQRQAALEAEARMVAEQQAASETQARVAAQRQAMAEAEARAAAERQAASEAEARAGAEARVRELEAQLRRLRGEIEPPPQA